MTDKWTGVDLDGTLAHDSGWHGPGHIGPPIPEMLARVKEWLRQGVTVKIMTARANEPGDLAQVREWLAKNGLPELEITASKDKNMGELWDNKAVEVLHNTGRPVNPLRRLVPAAQALPESMP